MEPESTLDLEPQCRYFIVLDLIYMLKDCMLEQEPLEAPRMPRVPLWEVVYLPTKVGSTWSKIQPV